MKHEKFVVSTTKNNMKIISSVIVDLSYTIQYTHHCCILSRYYRDNIKRDKVDLSYTTRYTTTLFVNGCTMQYCTHVTIACFKTQWRWWQLQNRIQEDCDTLKDWEFLRLKIEIFSLQCVSQSQTENINFNFSIDGKLALHWMGTDQCVIIDCTSFLVHAFAGA